MITGREISEIAELSSLPQFETAICMPELTLQGTDRRLILNQTHFHHVLK